MAFTGEIISLIVAVSWTATALFADVASHRIGTIPLNIIRLGLSVLFLGLTLLLFTGHAYPMYTDGSTWLWLSLSGIVGYVFGDYCLFNSYLSIGSRYGQLFMTLSPPTAAIFGYLMLGESLSWMSLVAMLVTLCGIGLSILSRGEGHKITTKLPMKGIFYGIGAGVGQGGGLVLSKIGMDSYAANMPASAPEIYSQLMPFSSTMIRAIVGVAGFVIILLCRGEWHVFTASMHDRRGVVFSTLACIFGPFIGVSLSLMAVQYTKAGIASTLMALTPMMIIWPHSLIYHDKVSAKEVVGTVISLVGVAMFFL